MNLFKSWIPPVVLALFLFACTIDDVSVEDWSPIAAVPIASTNFDVEDFFERSDSLENLFVIDEEGLLALEYNGSLFSFGLEDLLDIPDQSITQEVSFAQTDAEAIDAGLGINTSQGFDSPLTTDPDDIRIDEINLMGGSVDFIYTIQQDEVFQGTLELLGITDAGGNPLIFSIDSENTAVGVPQTASYDLTGAVITPTFVDDENSLAFLLAFNVSNNPNHVAFDGVALEMTIEINNPEIDYVTGYFGQMPVNTDQDSVRLRIFDNGLTGVFQLEQAFIDLEIENSFGFPVAFDLTDVQSVNLTTGEETDLIFDNNYELQGQATLDSEPEVALLSFDHTNTNITDVLEPSPKTIYFALNAVANPDGPPPPNTTNFIKHDSRLDVAIDVLLPLRGYAQNLLFADTVETEINFDSYDEIDSLEFKVYTANGFPMGASAQVVFLNEMDEPLDSLFAGLTPLFDPAPLGANGAAIGKSEKRVFAGLDNERSMNLDNTRKVVFRVLANTTNSTDEQFVRFQEECNMDIRIGVKIFGNIEL